MMAFDGSAPFAFVAYAREACAAIGIRAATLATLAFVDPGRLLHSLCTRLDGQRDEWAARPYTWHR